MANWQAMWRLMGRPRLARRRGLSHPGPARRRHEQRGGEQQAPVPAIHQADAIYQSVD